MSATKLVGGFRSFRASEVRAHLGEFSSSDDQVLEASFSHLVRDQQMGDGGEYRYRRYSRFLTPASLAPEIPDFRLTSGNSILQSLADNSLNGGVERIYQPLTEAVLQNNLFRKLIEHDIKIVRQVDPELFTRPVVIGVHQVRILAYPGLEGKPTPEGIHRDAERFTFQHLWSRQSVEGGEFRAYDQNRELSFRWLQETRFDSVLFEGQTWHSASPIHCQSGSQSGHRDIFLIDFEPAPTQSTL